MGEGQKLEPRQAGNPWRKYAPLQAAEMFLPDQWPAYFLGLRVAVDLDDRELIDTSIMGIGTTFSAGHPEVDAAVTGTRPLAT